MFGGIYFGQVPFAGEPFIAVGGGSGDGGGGKVQDRSRRLLERLQQPAVLRARGEALIAFYGQGRLRQGFRLQGYSVIHLFQHGLIDNYDETEDLLAMIMQIEAELLADSVHSA